MQGKVGGVVSAAAPAPGPQIARIPTTVRTPGRLPAGAAAPTKTSPAAAVTNVEIITDWGQRCCAKDVAELRSALAAIQALRPRLQDPAMLATLRRPGMSQLGPRTADLSAAIDAFVGTRDAQAATSALARISTGVNALSKLVNQRKPVNQ